MRQKLSTGCRKVGSHTQRAIIAKGAMGCLVSPQLAQTHGNVFTVWLGSTPIVVLNGFRAVKEALVSNSEQFSGRPLTPFFRDLFGEKGVICSNGLTWRQQRRFCLTTLRELGLGKQALELQLQHEAAELAEVFHQEQGRAFDPQVPIIRSTTRVIGALVFGHHFLSEEPIFLELIRAINLGLAFASTTWRRLYDMFPWALRYLSGPHQKIFQYHEAVRGFIHHEIIRHKLRTPEAPKDFISCYLSQITKAMDDPVSTFSEENLIQVVIDLFLGGTDTTATTLHWAIIYLVHHRAIQECSRNWMRCWVLHRPSAMRIESDCPTPVLSSTRYSALAALWPWALYVSV